MRQVIVVLLLLIAGAVVAAPAPLVKRERRQAEDPSQPNEGLYIISWGSSTEREGALFKDKTGWYMYFSTKYYFIWEWDPGTRCFEMWERSEGADGLARMNNRSKQIMAYYRFFLDYSMETDKHNDANTTSLKLQRRR